MKILKVIFWLPTLLPMFVIVFFLLLYQHFKKIVFISPEVNLPIVNAITRHQNIFEFVNFLFWMISIYLIK